MTKMTIERALELLKIEQRCVESAAGKWMPPDSTAIEPLPEKCDRDCANCKLCQDDEELISMYHFIIGYLELAREQLKWNDEYINNIMKGSNRNG